MIEYSLEKLKEEKVFKDPVHRYVHVNDRVIWDLIDTKEFQRLRRIKQLGTMYITFHGAEHSRFSHSLGVYEIVRRIVDGVFTDRPEWNPKDRLLSLCAALLHDLGHGPFSHAFEKVFELDHEEFTREIILGDTEVNAVLKKYDVTTDLAVISINLTDISDNTKAKIVKATLGNSIRLEAGMPVLAIGRADGSEDSMKVGTLTSTHNKQSVVDAEYTILVTDMMKNAGADGILINLNGEVIGIMQDHHLSSNMENVLTAYGISDIKSLLEHLSNNQDIAYLGIKGVSVTNEALKAGVPSGVYVTEVQIDSPAMKGGIQSGDVIQAINGQKVLSMSELSDVLSRLSNRQNITLEVRRLTRDGYKKTNYQTSLSVLE